MNRALRAAMTGVLLLSPVALSACSAGQVTQTASQNRDKTGGQAEVGPLALREVRLAYPVTGTYQEGGDARLIMAIANTAPSPDTLLSITSDAFQGVTVVPGAESSGAAASSAAPSGPNAVDVTIPANTNVYVGGDGPSITLTGLTRSLNAAQTVPLTLTFAQAGQVTVDALVGTSSIDVPRGKSFDFEQGGQSSEDTARQRETGGGDTAGGSAQPSGEASQPTG